MVVMVVVVVLMVVLMALSCWSWQVPGSRYWLQVSSVCLCVAQCWQVLEHSSAVMNLLLFPCSHNIDISLKTQQKAPAYVSHILYLYNIETFLTAAVGELRAEAGLLVVMPPPVVTGTGALSLGLQTDRGLRLRETQRLTVRLTDKPVTVAQTSSVREGSNQG